MAIAAVKQSTDDSLLEELRRRLGAEGFLSDEASRAYYANDIFWQPGVLPLAIALPDTRQAAAETVRIAAAAGVSIVPRGGGMSYTKGYLPSKARSIVVDTRRMNNIVELNPEDGYVTVEAGCTWAKLNEALDRTGMRTGYWGPLSGVNATIGGALSQNSAFFGSALNGTVADSVLGITALLANGEVVTTGSGGRKDAKPFTRHGGPDLTGLFLGDNGAFGVKLAATLKLLPRPAHQGHLSFGFETMARMAAAQVEMARTRLVAEGFGIDRTKAEHSASVNRISDGLKTLSNVVKAQGLKAAVQVASGGTAFLKAHNFTLHIVSEASSTVELDAALGALRAIGKRHGVEIENTVPKVMRSKPFGPVRGMLGLNGERWVPIHAVFPLSVTQEVVAANEAYFAGKRAFMERHGIVYSVMTMTVGSEFFIEPAFYWLDEITPLHARSVGEDVVRPWKDRPANVATRAAVIELRSGTQELYAGLGGVSWQVARDYPFESILASSTWSLVKAIKGALDPDGLMNPGSLGLAN